jgi:hypothetical protein
MAKYDPNWLAKLQAKERAKRGPLSHIKDEKAAADFNCSRGLCGTGYGAKGSPSITYVLMPDANNLPGCRTCREIFLKSIGVEINPETGYPLK